MPSEILVYRGGVENLTASLARKRSALERAYVKTLGLQDAQKVADVAKRVLVGGSFFNTIEEFRVFSGDTSSANRPNTFSVRASLSLDDTDFQPVQRMRISMTPVFYISERGVNPMTAPRNPETILSSFVHNYNKFVYFALQEPPLYTLAFGAHGEPETFIPYLLSLENSGLSSDEITRRSSRAYLSQIIQEINNCATDLLDRAVLDEIGVQVRLNWRNKPREFLRLGPTPRGMMHMLPQGGDPFFGVGSSNVRIIRNFADNWITFIGPKGFAPDVAKDELKEFLTSIGRNVVVDKLPITEFRPVLGDN